MNRITAQTIQNMAARYLNRYAPTISHFRSVLQRKVRRITQKPDELQAAFALIEAEIQRCIKINILNDQHIAEAWARRCHIRGLSALAIRQKLRQKGIADTLIDSTLNHLIAEKGLFQAAFNYAKRRRLGPFQTSPERRANRKQKDLAAMMRAGHSYDICKAIIHAESPEAAIQANENSQWK